MQRTWCSAAGRPGRAWRLDS